MGTCILDLKNGTNIFSPAQLLAAANYGRLYNYYAASTRSNGMLYNGFAVTDSRNIAPVGWHVPRNSDYDTLVTNLGGSSIAGGKLKETGTTYWNNPNEGATNEVGFNAIGTGMRDVSGLFYQATISNQINVEAYYWTADGYWYRIIGGFTWMANTNAIANNILQVGASVRLIKDNNTDTGLMVGNNGKVYPTVTINGQVWMAANLEETKFRNGEAIPIVTDNSLWGALKTAGSCWYNNTKTYDIAPAGYRLPNENDIITLIETLGGNALAGGKLKEAGFAHWASSNVGATNESNFTAVAAGRRDTSFSDLNKEAYFHFLGSSTNSLYLLALLYFSAGVGFSSYSKYTGLSLRFIRNKNCVMATNPTDFEGNSYPTVDIGLQRWLIFNWKSQHFIDGTLIGTGSVYTDAAWAALVSPGVCVENEALV